jgi:hypothetical protein
MALSKLDQDGKRFLLLCLFCFMWANYNSFTELRTELNDTKSASVGKLTPQSLKDIEKELPTSLTGLKVGDPWNNGGTLSFAQ